MKSLNVPLWKTVLLTDGGEKVSVALLGGQNLASDFFFVFPTVFFLYFTWNCSCFFRLTRRYTPVPFSWWGFCYKPGMGCWKFQPTGLLFYWWTTKFCFKQHYWRELHWNWHFKALLWINHEHFSSLQSCLCAGRSLQELLSRWIRIMSLGVCIQSQLRWPGLEFSKILFQREWSWMSWNFPMNFITTWLERARERWLVH